MLVFLLLIADLHLINRVPFSVVCVCSLLCNLFGCFFYSVEEDAGRVASAELFAGLAYRRSRRRIVPWDFGCEALWSRLSLSGAWLYG